MKDPLGVRAWRHKPLRTRLLPWPIYLIMSVVSLGLGLYLLTDPLEPNPVPVAVLFFVMVPPSAYCAVLSRRLRR